MQNLIRRDFLWIVPLTLVLGAALSALQPGNWLIGFASFSFLFLLSFSLFTIALRWANAGKTLAYILALSFALRLLVGVSLYIFLPIYGHEDTDDKAGFVFTDAHHRDDEAWKLASSNRFIGEAFSKKFAYDQYGGLLAFSALIYRYTSPDAHRPLLLILMSAIVAALGIPLLWKAVNQVFGEKVAWTSAWIFALYPESILLGTSIMREPYLMTCSAMTFWGFVNLFHRAEQSVLRLRAHLHLRQVQVSQQPLKTETNLEEERSQSAIVWLGLGLLGMLLVSPAIALVTLVILAGWMWFTSERRSISWKAILVFVLVFVVGLFFLSASLNRSGEFNSSSPLSVVNDWLRLAVNWNVYNIERDSGWVQKLFDEMPEWIRLPFVAIFGILQPALPAVIIVPTAPLWKVIWVLRSVGWYALLPMLILSFAAGTSFGSGKRRNIILWLSLLVWIWILLASLRGGGDQWDNPRYRTMLFVWQAILAGVVWEWWRETRSAWFLRMALAEVIFLIVFTQWYASRYYHWGGQLPFLAMIVLIFGIWVAIFAIGWWQDRKRTSVP